MTATVPSIGLPPLREGRPPDEALIARRGAPVPAETVLIGGVPCLTVETSGAAATIVHFHGGGYRLGSVGGWRDFADRLSRVTESRVILPDYALAPERPFPAALHDGVAVMQALQAASPMPLIMSGDSAGGGLALALATLIAPRPAGLILLSPWLDLSLTAESYDRCAETDALFSRAAAMASAADYLQGIDAGHPLASPLHADLSEMPPTLIMASASEVLCDDSHALVARMVGAGRRITALIEPRACHIWPVLEPEQPAGRRAFDQLALFVRSVSPAGSAGSIAASR